MSSKALLQNSQRVAASIRGAIIFSLCCLLGLVIITGCGSSSSATQLPRDFIQEFIVKHETMLDPSLVYYYVKEEQPKIAEEVDTAIRINEAKGGLEMLEGATFDFSGLQIEVIDKKEEYVNDEPVLFVKVSVRGKYTMELPGTSRKIEADEVIVLQKAHHEWKVTETRNPWS